MPAAYQAVTVATQASLSDAEQNQNSSHGILAELCFAGGSLFLDCTEFIKKLQPVPCKVC